MLAANLVLLIVVISAGPLSAQIARPFLPLGGLPPIVAGGAVYLLSTLIWYAWHRARHESRALWLGLHQLHHSPARIEVTMAFYKHPLEQIANALLSAAIAGPVFGLSPGAAVAYGPWLPEQTVQTVLHRAVCEDPTFRPALGLLTAPARVSIDARPAPGLPGPVRHVEVSCS